TTGAQIHILIPGRALLLSIPWQSDRTIHLLNVYASNDPSDNQCFWTQLSDIWELNKPLIPKANIMLNDFNLIEDELDRFPPHADHAKAVTELNALKTRLNLYDSWCATYPDTRDFSFYQGSTGSQSRIDRIYTSRNLL
ncbi:uncharacterized protein PHACADRAFT_89185, partial [Phanerochaete carnosa HHB-10118-sp]